MNSWARLPVAALLLAATAACSGSSHSATTTAADPCDATALPCPEELVTAEPNLEPVTNETTPPTADAPKAPAPTATPTPTATRASRPTPSESARSGAATATLLFAGSGGDGDSWKDRQGREYRLGLVNTPEYNQCYGSTATARRKAMVANGFRANTYTTDTYGRRVSVITTASGVNLNVYLARHGYANDKYLDQFRHENPSLATKLDAAFAAARREKAGLWGACGAGGSTTGSTGGSSSGTTGSSGSCHPDYKTCIPIKGDGSGNGQENDLDCGDINKPVYLRQVSVDPYRLDADGDGVGCDS